MDWPYSILCHIYIINLINQNKIAITYLDYCTTNKVWDFL
ncbi:hypothetical protein VCHA28O22_20508 [Vibrio chagasii]|nr:hypothetical protein VCHA28O22_20508 [Vibrio chagasii]CAH6906898.1 hypothetical protein VCHA50O393_100030 [Vibrio chagasii]CAH6926606.1 hypothetical protein VCHA53O474_100030 [Vibrio chagasii]